MGYSDILQRRSSLQRRDRAGVSPDFSIKSTTPDLHINRFQLTIACPLEPVNIRMVVRTALLRHRRRKKSIPVHSNGITAPSPPLSRLVYQISAFFLIEAMICDISVISCISKISIILFGRSKGGSNKTCGESIYPFTSI